MNTPPTSESNPELIWPGANIPDLSETGIPDLTAEVGYWNGYLLQTQFEKEKRRKDQGIKVNLLTLFKAHESPQVQTSLKRKQEERAKEAVRHAKELLQQARRELLACTPLKKRKLPASFFIIPGPKNAKGNATFAELPHTARGQSAPQATKPPQGLLPPLEDMDDNMFPADGGLLEANDSHDPMLAMLANDIENGKGHQN